MWHLFAGFGTLSEEYAKAGCDRLICVEKEEEINPLKKVG